MCVFRASAKPRRESARRAISSWSATPQAAWRLGAIRPENCKPALSSRAQRSGVEGSRELATTPDVLGSSRGPSTPLRCARDDSAGVEVCGQVADREKGRKMGALPPALQSRAYLPCNLINSPGAIPSTLLNAREKWYGSAKRMSPATCFTIAPGRCRSSAAWAIFNRIRYWYGVW